MIIDTHSHILPGLDNGSKDTNTSIAMLKEMQSLGIDFVVATPHFNAEKQTIEDFLFDRNESYVNLGIELGQNSLKEGFEVPEIILGAEVELTKGLENLPSLERLCIENTDLLLLEMPNRVWTTEDYSCIARLSMTHHYGVILAHYERYTYNHKTDIANKILKLPIYVQADSESFTKFISGKKLLADLVDGFIHLLGSNSHSAGEKHTGLNNVRNLVKQKYGQEVLERIDSFTMETFNIK